MAGCLYFVSTIKFKLVGFSFSRFYLRKHYTDDGTLYKGVKLYNVYNGKDLYGQYFRHGNKHYYKLNGNSFEIESIEKWYKKPQYKIINESAPGLPAHLLSPAITTAHLIITLKCLIVYLT